MEFAKGADLFSVLSSFFVHDLLDLSVCQLLFLDSDDWRLTNAVNVMTLFSYL